MLAKAVLTDWDGVLLDSFRNGMRRIQELCALHDLPFTRETRQRLFRNWGMAGIELLEKSLEINHTLAERIYTGWERLDKANPPPLILGARDVLLWLRKNGFKTALITSRREKHLHELLDDLDLEREFAVVTTLETCGGHRKPDPLVFRYALETLETEFGITRSQCIFVGDTPADTDAGKNAHIETLVVQTGPYLLEHINEHPIPLGNVLKSIDDLPQWIEKHHDGELKTLYS